MPWSKGTDLMLGSRLIKGPNRTPIARRPDRGLGKRKPHGGERIPDLALSLEPVTASVGKAVARTSLPASSRFPARSINGQDPGAFDKRTRPPTKSVSGVLSV
jgi:hypothetical protein